MDTKTALVVGGAACVWSDLREAPEADAICVNDIIMHYPGPVPHAYSNNAKMLKHWCAARRDQYVMRWGEVGQTHSYQDGADRKWDFSGQGTSSMGAVRVALGLGYEKVFLCGVPLDDSPHYFEGLVSFSNFTREVPLKGNGEMKYWAQAAQEWNPGREKRVQAISGRLTEIL